MSMFKLTPSSEDKKVTFHQEDDSAVPYTKIEELQLEGDASSGNLKMHQEDLGSDKDNPTERKKLTWGSEPTACSGKPGEYVPPPEFIPIMGADGTIYIYLNYMRHQVGSLYQFLVSLPADKTVKLFIFGVAPAHTTALQMAIIMSKATIHTKFMMVENDVWESGIFFTWMVGNVLEPVPYGVISLVEPMTLFSYSSNGNSSAKNDDINFDATIKKQWYDYAESIGLLTNDEIVQLNQGKAILITNINDRIIEANKIKAQGDNPYFPKEVIPQLNT